MENLTLTITSPKLSTPVSESRKELCKEWIARFAVNAGQSLTREVVSVMVSLWAESFSDLSDEVLTAAFRKTIQSCRFWPVKVADVLEHVSHAEENAVSLQAEEKWQQVLAYAQTTSPDYPSRPMRIKEQTQAAIRAAGGLDWIRDCPQDDLEWAKKRFVEAFTSWNVLEKNKFLLPDGELKNQIAGAAQKLLPEAKP